MTRRGILFLWLFLLCNMAQAGTTVLGTYSSITWTPIGGGTNIATFGGGASPYWTDTNTPILFVKMNTNAAGNCVDYSSYAFGMTNTGVVISYPFTNSQGVAKANGYFDGTDDKILLDATDVLTMTNGAVDSPFTVMACLKASVAGADDNIIGKVTAAIGKYEWILFYRATGRLALWCMSGGGSTKWIGSESYNAISTNEYRTFAATYDGSGTSGGIKLYTNGVLAPAGATWDQSYVKMSNTAARVDIGNGQGWQDEFQGNIAWVAVYKYVVSTADIRSNFVYRFPTNYLGIP